MIGAFLSPMHARNSNDSIHHFHRDEVLADFKTKKAEVDTRRASAEQELARLDNKQRLIEQAALETASLMEYCARVRSALQHFTMEKKRRALEALKITVGWHPEKPLKIRGSIPVRIVTIAP